jgi:hypothetical protein
VHSRGGSRKRSSWLNSRCTWCAADMFVCCRAASSAQCITLDIESSLLDSKAMWGIRNGMTLV